MRTRHLARALPRALAALVLAAACWAGLTAGAQANIVSVTTSPSTGQVVVPNGSAVTITWQVRRANTVRAATQTIISTSGLLTIGGTTVATIGTTVSKVNVTPAGQATIETIVETLLVPRNVALQIARNPSLTARYSRTFDDGSGFTSSGSLSLIPSGPSAGELTIRRLELSFQDHSRVQVLPRGNDLFALADINFTGSGVAQFEWQVAEPSSTRGALVFRRLQIVRQNLAGGTRATLRSPRLPTSVDGLYIVRLVSVDPQLPFDTPELKYFVVPEQGATSAPAGQQIALLQPVDNAPLTVETQFAWQEVPGAAVYQLEVYPSRPGNPVGPATSSGLNDPLLVDPDELAQRPIAGIALPASKHTASLKAFSLARLEPGQSYLWRVKAIARNGSVIGTSPLRRITVPR